MPDTLAWSVSGTPASKGGMGGEIITAWLLSVFPSSSARTCYEALCTVCEDNMQPGSVHVAGLRTRMRSGITTQASMPELPSSKRRRYAELGLPRADVLLLTDDVASAAYFEAAVAAGAPPKAASNWILGDIAAFCNVRPRRTQASRGNL